MNEYQFKEWLMDQIEKDPIYQPSDMGKDDPDYQTIYIASAIVWNKYGPAITMMEKVMKQNEKLLEKWATDTLSQSTQTK